MIHFRLTLYSKVQRYTTRGLRSVPGSLGFRSLTFAACYPVAPALPPLPACMRLRSLADRDSESVKGVLTKIKTIGPLNRAVGTECLMKIIDTAQRSRHRRPVEIRFDIEHALLAIIKRNQQSKTVKVRKVHDLRCPFDTDIDTIDIVLRQRCAHLIVRSPEWGAMFQERLPGSNRPSILVHVRRSNSAQRAFVVAAVVQPAHLLLWILY